MYDQKNAFVEQYIDSVVENLKASNIPVSLDQRNRAIEMFKDSSKTVEEIKKEIDELVQQFIENYLEMMRKRQEYMEKMKMKKQSIDIQKLIDNKTLVCGRMVNEDGIVRFERVEPSQINTIPEDERAYATTSMGRAVFTIDDNGLIHNYKGVDSHLSTSEIGLVDLVSAKSIEYAPNKEQYKVSAIVFHDEKPEIRINGAAPLEDIEIEADINKKLADMGVKVPEIKYIKEMPQDYSIKYGLPIKVNGSLSDLNSDYAVEDDERKNRLQEIYGSNYTQELSNNQRPETMSEYLQRIGFLSSKELQTQVESLGYSIDTFIKKVDENYSRGQRYGQAERIMGSPFRISDLEACIANHNMEQLKSIMDFSENQNINFEDQLAECYGKNVAMLMNNGWQCNNLIHRQDFSLSGEFCDDSYHDMIEKYSQLKEKHKDEPYIADEAMIEMKRKYTGQVMHVASCVKVVQEAMQLTGKDQEKIDGVLDKYVDSFANNIDFNKIGEKFNVDANQAEESFFEEFRPEQKWSEKMAAHRNENGMVIEEDIYSSHNKNDDYYNKVSGMITEKVLNKQNNQKNQLQENKVRKLVPQTNDSTSNTNTSMGYTNVLILSLIVGFACGVVSVITYLLLKG